MVFGNSSSFCIGVKAFMISEMKLESVTETQSHRSEPEAQSKRICPAILNVRKISIWRMKLSIPRKTSRELEG